MSKKDKETLQYLQSPLPNTKQNSYKSIKLNWGGLNKRNVIDTGELSMEHNISTQAAPYLTPSEKRVEYCDIEFPNPMNLYGFGDCLFVVNKDRNVAGEKFAYTDDNMIDPNGSINGSIKDRTAERYGIYGNLFLERYRREPPGDYANDPKKIVNAEFVFLNRIRNNTRMMRLLCTGWYTNIGNIEGEIATKPQVKARANKSRCLVRFNVFTNTDSPLTSDVIKKILVYPDMMASVEDYTSDNMDYDYFGEKLPILDYATAQNSRVFGVTNNTVFASGYNSYTNYRMDNAINSSAENAWYTTTQSNTKGDGNFTGIAAYGGHVVCFKKDFMHEIYNNKNPFRIQDVYAEGCIDNRTIQDVDGTLFFVSEDNVKVYTGGNPEIISYNLGIKKFKNCCAGNDGRNYYLYCEDEKDQKAIFVFDTLSKKWSQQSIDDQVVGFANTTEGMFLLTKYAVVTKETDESTGKESETTNYYGKIYKIDTEDYNHAWSFETDVITTLSNARTVDIKHIKKLQLLGEFSENSRLKVYIVYDGEEFDENKSQLLCEVSGKTGIHPIRVLIRKGANRSFKLRFEGYGYIKLYEMEIITMAGGVKDVSG